VVTQVNIVITTVSICNASKYLLAYLGFFVFTKMHTELQMCTCNVKL